MPDTRKTGIAPDPPVRKDGTCARCCRPRRAVNPKSQYPGLERLLSRDPFCTSACCRAFHGVKLSKPEMQDGKHAEPDRCGRGVSA